jgi:hypothetical protein
MMKGDLVWVMWPDRDHPLKPYELRLRPAIVLDYRPDVLGGSSMYTSRWNDGDRSQVEVAATDRRGEALIRLLDGEGTSWIDEAKLQLSLSGAPGA